MIQIDRIIAEGQNYLDGQIRIAMSADQRASSLAGVFTAAGSALIAGLIALAALSKVSHLYPIYAGGAISAVLFLVAASLCILATFPTKLWLAGCEPSIWNSDIKLRREFRQSLIDIAGHIQDKITENSAAIDQNATRFRWGSALGIASPVVGVVVWLLTSSVYWLA
jgi:hypothetical protein